MLHTLQTINERRLVEGAIRNRATPPAENTPGGCRNALSCCWHSKHTHMRSENTKILGRPRATAEFTVTARRRAGLWWGNSNSSVVGQERPADAGGVHSPRQSGRRRGGQHREPRRRSNHRREQQDSHGAGDCCGSFVRRDHVCNFFFFLQR